MSSLENKISVLRLDYTDKSNIIEFTKDKYKAKFNWKCYVKYYKDLQFRSLDDAWTHWIKKGIHEQKKFFINNTLEQPIKLKHKEHVKFKQIVKRDNFTNYTRLNVSYSNLNEPIINTTLLCNYNNLIYKNVYDNYGVQYYGWKNVINNCVHELINEMKTNPDSHNYNNDKSYLFDEWLEKLLIWGDKNENKYIINEILKNNYKLITFIHNPPFVKWHDNIHKANVKNDIIYNDDYTNKKLFELLTHYKLADKITYLYTLSITHKEYIYNKVPMFNSNLVSIFHPIKITGDEKVFDFNLFTQNRQIIHIGWQLRNFKKFIDLKLPHEFFKTILIKTGFEQEWDNISTNHELDKKTHKEYITILKELKNIDYEKVFVNSCVFLYLEDCVITNTILECMKFNTPIIINKLPSIVEYLGEDYPLYYENDTDLANLKNSNFLLSNIKKANEYLQNMDKSHISEQKFYTKIKYDIQKTNLKDTQLTWFCYINSLTNVTQRLHNIYTAFCSQLNNAQNFLQIIISDTLCKDPDINNEYANFIAKLDMFQELVNNISYKIIHVDSYGTYLNTCFHICETQFITFVSLNQVFYPNFSCEHITYLVNNLSCDIVFSSYKTTHKTFNEQFIFDTNYNVFLSNYSKSMLPYFGIVFRKHLRDIITFNEQDYYDNTDILFREFCLRAINNHLNITCCSNKILFVNNP